MQSNLKKLAVEVLEILLTTCGNSIWSNIEALAEQYTGRLQRILVDPPPLTSAVAGTWHYIWIDPAGGAI